MAENGNDNGNNSDSNSSVSVLHDLIAGGVAGSASVIIGHPFDTIKVRIQTSLASLTRTKPSFISLFNGMAAPLCTAAIVNAIIFGSYGFNIRLWENYFENSRHDESDYAHGVMMGEGAVFIEHGQHEIIKDQQPAAEQQLEQQTGRGKEEQTPNNSSIVNNNDDISSSKDNNTAKIFMCGAAAGTAQSFVICPMEHIKCRLQVNTNNLYKGPVDLCTSLIKNHGIFNGLFRGMGVTLWRETPAFGMYFATYDTIKDRVTNLLDEKADAHPIPSHAHAWTASALAGGISGAWTWVIIYPFDVIKSQIQTGPLHPRGSKLRKGMWTVGADLIKEHGWQFMFRGLGITVARAFPVNAIIFPVYEFVLVQLGDGG